jgi:uncharacterized protein
MSTVGVKGDLAAKIDAGPIALTGFATSTFILSAVNMNWVKPPLIFAAVASAWIMGGLVQFVIGIYSIIQGRLFAGVAFSAYGGFWLSYATYAQFYVKNIPEVERGHAGALFLAPWLIFTLFLWIASIRTNLALFIGLGMLEITIAALVIGDAKGIENWTKFGGVVGLILAVEIFYLAAAELINQVFERPVLPIVPLSKPAPAHH